MGTPLKDRNRAMHKRYKEDVEREGKSFFPYAVLHDSIMSLVVVAVIIGLAVVWHETADGTEAGILGPWYTEEADPGTIEFVPRPDWFFYFLFYLLRIFKWPESVFLGTVGIPTILLILLIGLPFYDRRPERRLSRRPVALVAAILVVISMGVLTWKGATAKEALGSEIIAAGTIDEWAEKQGVHGQRACGRRRDAVRAVGLHELPHLHGRGQLESRRARTSPMWARLTAASSSSSRTSRTRRSTGTT